MLSWDWTEEGWVSIQIPTFLKQAFYNERIRRTKSMKQGNTLIKDDPSKQVSGDIAQALVMAWLSSLRLPYETTEPKDKYDMVVNGKKIDIKAANRKEKPLLEYNCNVTQSQLGYDIDGYLFSSVVGDTLYLTGYISKEDFLEKMEIKFPDDKWAAIRLAKYGPAPSSVKINQTMTIKEWIGGLLIGTNS